MADDESFFAAIAAGDLAAVRAHLDADVELLRANGPQGASPALTALYHGHGPLADELAARQGPLTIFEAAAFDDADRINELLLREPGAVASWSPDGWQPLHLAAFFGRAAAARALLDADAPVDEPSRNVQAVLPLHSAAAGAHHELVWVLIASDADVQARQAGGHTALHSAAGNADLESVRALLAAGADPEATDDRGRTPRQLLPSDADDSVRELLLP
jgi:ankyrin repeat protein